MGGSEQQGFEVPIQSKQHSENPEYHMIAKAYKAADTNFDSNWMSSHSLLCYLWYPNQLLLRLIKINNNSILAWSHNPPPSL